MDAAAALADLTEISSQVEAAVLLDREGIPIASTPDGDARSERLAEAGRELIETAERRFGAAGRGVTQLEVALREGSVFVAREPGGRAIVARTGADPSSGLVFYDLGTCLSSVAQAAKPARRAPRKKKATEAPADA